MPKYWSEKDLELAQAGDRAAIGRICKGMEGAVVKTATNFSVAFPVLEFDDLIQAGYLAVLKCIRGFNPKRKTAKFSSYCYSAILNAARTMAKKESNRAAREVAIGDWRWEGQSVDATDAANLGLYAKGDRGQIELASNLAQEEALVVYLRLRPLLQDKPMTPWLVVGKKLPGKSLEELRSLYESAIDKIVEAN